MKRRTDRSRLAGDLAAALLATTCLTALVGPAGAQGMPGATGGFGLSGGPGFVDTGSGTTTDGGSGGPGDPGSPPSGNTGGIGGTGGTGGIGGMADGANEADIASGGPGGNGGPGGAGGAGSGPAPGSTLVNSATIVGGSGGTGGVGGLGGAASNATINALGGSGGAGGIGGAGGSGIAASGVTIINSGTILGGEGGTGGQGGIGGNASSGSGVVIGGFGGDGGTAGAGGVGISGSDLTVVNSGTISGGIGGASGSPGSSPTGGAGGGGGNGGQGGSIANAITFTGGTNVLELHATSVITGNVVAFGGDDTLRLGGGGSATFDNTLIGVQYLNFGNYEKTGTGTWTLSGIAEVSADWAITQGTLAISEDLSLGLDGMTTFNGGTLQALADISLNPQRVFNLEEAGGTIDTNGFDVSIGLIEGPGGLTKDGQGTLTLREPTIYEGGTTVNAGTLLLQSGATLNPAGALTVNGGTFDITNLEADLTVGALSGAGGTIDLGPNTLTTDSGANTTLASQITGSGALVKQGSGILALTGSNDHTGGTVVSGGLINFNALGNFGSGPITLDGGGLQWASGNTIDISSRLAALGAGGGIFDTNGNDVTLAGTIGGPGGLTKQGGGLLNLTGASTYGGPTMVNGGTLAVNGSITSDVTVGAAGTLGGTGTIGGNVNTLGTLAPGNSIGTLTVVGNFTQAAGSVYQVEVNAAGQGDRINVGGTATINGGTVQALAQPGSYGPSTTYTIVNATGGVTGTYSSVTSNFAFLTPSLSYDANNVFLTLALQQGNDTGFLMSAYTPNQKAVGAALNQSFARATGDYATVIGALAGLSAFQGPAALNAISGEQYADFGTMNVNNSAMFMNAVGQQMAVARGAVAGSGQRAALAQACDIAACNATSPFSVWAGGLGGFGAVAGDYNASTATYNYAGAAVGIDYRIDPRFLVGLAAAYTAGNLWVDSFPGKGWTNSVAVAAYGSFTQDGFYVDALAGYGWFSNQLQRQISIPGLQPLTATGSTNANQALGQIETGYRIGVFAPAAATVAPFARLQGSSVTQNGFSENGAQSLSLDVQQQTTNSLRTLFGLDLAGAVPLGSDRTLDLGLRLGWQHEFASTMRPITASLSGAPFTAFTVYGATPQSDAAVVSLRGSTAIAAGTQLYLRYDGEVGGGTDNHAFNLGVRLSW